MAIRLAYLGVILVWTTTPLAVKWSSEGPSFMFGVTARMVIGAVCLLLLMAVTRQGLPFHGAARRTYLAVTLQLYLSMSITYWGAQFIPSGWISLIFGMSPLMTALLAAGFLQERSLGWGKLLSYLLGLAGLGMMFISAIDLNPVAQLGLASIVLSTFIHAASAVWVKRINAGLPALQQISGGMLLSLPLYLLSWALLDESRPPEAIPDKALFSIIYLGVIATTLGFALYYYLLTHLPATNVSMINMVTPVSSLLLGAWVNQEVLSVKIGIGAGLIIAALLLHQKVDRPSRLKAAKGVG